MKKSYYVQVNDYMTPVKVDLTEYEANTVASVLKEIVKSDPEALVSIEDEDGHELYGNFDTWSLPRTYAEIEYDDLDTPEALAGCHFDDMNYLRYRER